MRKAISRRFVKNFALFVILFTFASCNGLTAKDLTELFTRYWGIFPSNRVAHSEPAFEFEKDYRELDITYQYKGKTYTLDQLFKRTDTTGFLVVKDDKIVYERYLRGTNETTYYTSWSVAKSFVSALVGIAIDEGHIESVDDPITKYVPELKKSGYNNVPIKHVLQMSSGIKFSEQYFNPASDVYRMLQKVVFLKHPLEDYIVNLKSERASGEYFHYASIDTLALGMLLNRTTGKSLSEYLREKIWEPLGMESDAYWNVDNTGVELSFCCLNARLRDYAKFGRLYLKMGDWNGKRIVSEKWVLESVVPDSPHLQPGETEDGWGYQYQWWIPENPDGEYLACGVFGQYLYVYPKKNIIIVKTSADIQMADDESVAAFRAIAEHLR